MARGEPARGLRPGAIWTGVLLGGAVALAAAAVAALVAHWVMAPPLLVARAGRAALLLGALVGGARAGTRAGSRLLFHGGASGLVLVGGVTWLAQAAIGAVSGPGPLAVQAGLGAAVGALGAGLFSSPVDREGNR